jgi:hypothetical protein
MRSGKPKAVTPKALSCFWSSVSAPPIGHRAVRYGAIVDNRAQPSLWVKGVLQAAEALP